MKITIRVSGAVTCVAMAAAALAGCTQKSNWTEQQLETEGAALVKTQFGADVTLDCPAGLENKQGPSVMCTGSDGKMWLFSATNKGELRAQKGQG